jgi:hypothetical protein
MNGTAVARFEDFSGQTRTFPELEEQPDYFVKEVKQSRQMNFQELESYIQELQQSGFDTVALQVQFHKKFSVPFFALIMAMISIPFAFLAGNHRLLVGGAGVRAGGQLERVARAGGRLVSRCNLLAGWALFSGPHAHMRSPYEGMPAPSSRSD